MVCDRPTRKQSINPITSQTTEPTANQYYIVGQLGLIRPSTKLIISLVSCWAWAYMKGLCPGAASNSQWHLRLRRAAGGFGLNMRVSTCNQIHQIRNMTVHISYTEIKQRKQGTHVDFHKGTMAAVDLDRDIGGVCSVQADVR